MKVTTLLSRAENPQAKEPPVCEEGIAALEGEVTDQEELVSRLFKVGFPSFCHAWVALCCSLMQLLHAMCTSQGLGLAPSVTLTQ